MGGRIPLSSELAEAMLEVLTEYHNSQGGIVEEPELRALASIPDIQDRWSKVPTESELVIERLTTREGHHLFLYPFAGRRPVGAATRTPPAAP